MCAILDADAFSKFKDPADEDMEPVWKWLENRNGKIVYAKTKSLKRNGKEVEWIV